jgi:regulator of RNase E activity RraA
VPLPAADQELFDLMATRLYSAVVSDVLDQLGHREHAMDPGIQPIDPSHVLVGRAMTVRIEETADVPADPYRGEIAALDDLHPGEVLVGAARGSHRAALWGELFSTAARARGARGAILDGLARDQRKIREMGFPVFRRGTLPLDCNGRTAMREHREPVVCGGAIVRTGDVVFADEDGIVVIPATLVHETATRALEKVAGEDAARATIRAGMLVREAFDRYRVL